MFPKVVFIPTYTTRLWSVVGLQSPEAATLGFSLFVVRTGFEPVYVDMVSTVDYPPHLTTYPCVYPYTT